MKKSFYYISFLFIVFLLGSCSTKKNTKASRFYHSFNSRYNIYFNGKNAFDEALETMQNGYKESYSDRIHLFPISGQPKDKKETGGPFDRAIEKSNKAIKLHSIKAKPPKKPGWRNDPKQRAWQEQEEYNPFLKKCWLLMGQSQFYNADFLQASATFSYIARHYSHDEEVVAEARLWQARCYNEMGWLYEAEDILGKLNTNGIPAKSLNQYATVYTDYLVKNKQFEEAIPYFRIAIKAEKNKKQRARMKYLLGQIYADREQNALAYQMFGQVIKANPPYELEFAARIRQTEVFSGTHYQKVIKMLRRMARNPKNKDLLDQVYYALGNVYLSRQDTAPAISNYRLGIEKSTRNGLDKAICQIKLGDIYFEKRDYVNAQPCFNGALAGIQKEYREYPRVSKLSAVLDELVVHVEAVHLQDSLQTVAKMPEKERLALIDKVIERVKKEEKEAKALAEKEAYLADQAAKGTGINRPGTETGGITLPVAGGGSSFYFYNPQTVAQGKTAFQRKWGRRPLEDNWRRRKKEMTTFDEPSGTEETIPADSLMGPDGTVLLPDSLEASLPAVAADDPKTREYYIQQLPLTPEDVEASNLIIEDGLYHMAMIYKDKLEDLPLAIEAFEELERRFPDNRYRLESYYQIYLMALRTGNNALATEYKNKLIQAYPQSDYAVAIADPNYAYNIRMMDVVQDSIYEATYHRYLAEDTSAVRRNFQKVSAKYPLATLLPKFMFLNALTYVQAGDPEGFKNALKALLDRYPSADVSELAGEMLKGVLRGRALVQGGMKGMNWNLRFGVADDGSLSAADSARVFVAEPNTSYRMLLMFPAGSLDKNQLLFAVAAYNFSNFMVKEFDLSFEDAGPMSLLAIHGFVNFDEILHYYKMIYGEDGYAASLDNNVAILPISDDNYETLMRGKTLEEYLNFFEENYGEILPELFSRWKARMQVEGVTEEEDKAPVLVSEEEDAETEEPAVSSSQSSAVKKTVRPGKRSPASLVSPPVPAKGDSAEVERMIPDTLATLLPIPGNPGDSLVIPSAKLDTSSISTISSPEIQKPEEKKDLTLEEIEEIRKREAAEEEARKEEARKAFEAEQKAQKELQERKARENAELLEKQKEEEAALLKAKEEREKQLKRDRKEKLKQQAADRKAKLKARKDQQKEKERLYKVQQKEKQRQRKQKEKEYKKALKAKEKARREALKAKEKAARKR